METKNQEIIDALKDAQNHLYEAIELMKWAVRENPEVGQYYRNYTVASVQIAAGESEWMSADPSLESWISQLSVPEIDVCPECGERYEEGEEPEFADGEWRCLFCDEPVC